MTRIAVVDDHRLFRFGLVSILKSELSFIVDSEFSSVTAVKPLLAFINIDVIITDLSLGNESGLALLRLVKEQRRDIKVVMLTQHKEDFYIFQALEAGVDGYLHKDIAPDELNMAIKKIATGEKFFCKEVTQVLMNNMSRKTTAVNEPLLTKKEKEVIHYLVQGQSSKDISVMLSISPRTVDTHRSNILAKLNLKNTAELVKKVADNNIIL